MKFNAQNVGLKIFWLPIGGSRISGGTGGGQLQRWNHQPIIVANTTIYVSLKVWGSIQKKIAAHIVV